MVAVSNNPEIFVVVKDGISPAPEAARPTSVLSFVQE